MKTICHICERAFELVTVTFSEKPGLRGEGFYLIPEHAPLEGKKRTRVVNQNTGEVIKELCDGSLRPPKIIVH